MFRLSFFKVINSCLLDYNKQFKSLHISGTTLELVDHARTWRILKMNYIRIHIRGKKTWRFTAPLSNNVSHIFQALSGNFDFHDSFVFYFQKLYQRPNGESQNQVYRSQLAASLKAFQQKNWTPLNYQELETNYMRCKPVQAVYDNRYVQLRLI